MEIHKITPTEKIIYILLTSVVSALVFIISFLFQSPKVNADVPTLIEYCGIGGSGYMGPYCQGQGYDSGGTCSPALNGTPCCSIGTT